MIHVFSAIKCVCTFVDGFSKFEVVYECVYNVIESTCGVYVADKYSQYEFRRYNYLTRTCDCPFSEYAL